MKNKSVVRKNPALVFSCSERVLFGINVLPVDNISDILVYINRRHIQGKRSGYKDDENR